MQRLPLSDFTDAEYWCVETALQERYGKQVDIERVDIELRLDPVLPQLTLCPALYWKEGAAFIIGKIGAGRFRAQFFYSVREQYGTGREEYDDLAECVVTLLKLQADQETTRRSVP